MRLCRWFLRQLRSLPRLHHSRSLLLNLPANLRSCRVLDMLDGLLPREHDVLALHDKFGGLH